MHDEVEHVFYSINTKSVDWFISLQPLVGFMRGFENCVKIECIVMEKSWRKSVFTFSIYTVGWTTRTKVQSSMYCTLKDERRRDNFITYPKTIYLNLFDSPWCQSFVFIKWLIFQSVLSPTVDFFSYLAQSKIMFRPLKCVLFSIFFSFLFFFSFFSFFILFSADNLWKF